MDPNAESLETVDPNAESLETGGGGGGSNPIEFQELGHCKTINFSFETNGKLY